jgi:hypothetical protein
MEGSSTQDGPGSPAICLRKTHGRLLHSFVSVRRSQISRGASASASVCAHAESSDSFDDQPRLQLSTRSDSHRLSTAEAATIRVSNSPTANMQKASSYGGRLWTHFALSSAAVGPTASCGRRMAPHGKSKVARTMDISTEGRKLHRRRLVGGPGRYAPWSASNSIRPPLKDLATFPRLSVSKHNVDGRHVASLPGCAGASPVDRDLPHPLVPNPDSGSLSFSGESHISSLTGMVGWTMWSCRLHDDPPPFALKTPSIETACWPLVLTATRYRTSSEHGRPRKKAHAKGKAIKPRCHFPATLPDSSPFSLPRRALSVGVGGDQSPWVILNRPTSHRPRALKHETTAGTQRGSGPFAWAHAKDFAAAFASWRNAIFDL